MNFELVVDETTTGATEYELDVPQNAEYEIAQMRSAPDPFSGGGDDSSSDNQEKEEVKVEGENTDAQRKPIVEQIEENFELQSDQDESPIKYNDLSYSERTQIEDFQLYNENENDFFFFANKGTSYTTILNSVFSSDSLIEISGNVDNSEIYNPEILMPVIDRIIDPYNYIYGTIGDDVITGTSGKDKIYLLDGNDTINFSAGADIIYGGLGTDTFDFSGEGSNFSVNLLTGAASNGSTGFSIYGVENVVGGSGNDVITGNADSNNISSGAGNDRIVGSAGNDTLDGEGGQNTLDYSNQTATLNVNLSTNTATGAGIGTDTITNFSILRLGSGDDTATGSAGVDTFYDGAGDDNISGGNGDDIFYAGAGNDTLNGNGGDDWIYFDVSSDVTVNLGTSTASSASTGTDSVVSFSRAVTGSGDDTIIGCSCNNILRSGAGDDSIDGAGGNDNIYGGSGADTLTGGSGADGFYFLAADGLDDFDTITDFNTGQGDFIDISDVLTGYNSGTDDIDDFVSFVVSGGDVYINVDIDGTGTDYASTAIALITGGAALDMDTLIAASDLIVA